MDVKTRLIIALHRVKHVKLGDLFKYYFRFGRGNLSNLYAVLRPSVEGAKGLEIGGPSEIFQKGLLPIYSLVEAIDNCQFSNITLWQGAVKEGPVSWAKKGRQFIVDGSMFNERKGEYDFVVSSHVLEHIANPLKALQTWADLLRQGGALVAIMPHKTGTFDHRRPYTAFEHILADFQQDISEADLTHLPEVLRLHDGRMDPGWQSPEEFERSLRENLCTRRMHHHVFSMECVVQMLDYLNLRIIGMEIQMPHHMIVVAQKVAPQEFIHNQNCNEHFLLPEASWKRTNPFRCA